MAGLGDFVGGGLQFVGDLLQMDQQRQLTHQSLDTQTAEAEKNRQLQEEFAKNGIQWKVADAQAAGLSPLYALSGGASYSPGPLPVMQLPDMTFGKALSNMGQNVSRAAMAAQTEEERQKQALSIDLVRSQIGETDARAAYYNELRRRSELQGAVSNPIQLDGGPASAFLEGSQGTSSAGGIVLPENFQDRSGLRGAVKVSPAPVVSSQSADNSVVAGHVPAWFETRVSPGLPMLVPYDNNGVGQAWSNMGPGEKLSVLVKNWNYYGPSWLPTFLSSMYGSGRVYDSLMDLISDSVSSMVWRDRTGTRAGQDFNLRKGYSYAPSPK